MGEGLKGSKEGRKEGVIEYSNFESGSLKFLPRRRGESCYSVDVIRKADNVIIKFLLPDAVSLYRILLKIHNFVS